MPEYRHGPYSIAGAKLVTCEVCGHHIEDDRCEYCRNTGNNGAWIDKVIEQAKDPRHDQSAFKDKKKKKDDNG